MIETEIEKVVKGGYCVGCAACTAVGNSQNPIKIRLSEIGQYEAVLTPSLDQGELALASKVCPFSGTARNEEAIASDLFSGPDIVSHPTLGRFRSSMVGSVAENGFRDRGSSGGFTSWILAELLVQKRVDAVLHVRPCAPGSSQHGALFEFCVAASSAELALGAKSHYYPVELSSVLAYVRENDRRFALVGVPCFIKAVRLLAEQDARYSERILYFVGLFCGHLKGTGFAELLAYQCGVEPKGLSKIDFRTKLEGRPASRYGVTITGSSAQGEVTAVRPTSDLIGTDWGMGFFKYKACDFCDDFSAEVADVSVGDAWLPEYVNDSRGTNVVLVRNKEIQALVDAGVREGRLDFKGIAASEIEKSQIASVRHRRDDLGYRLNIEAQAGRWYPKKRVAASGVVSAEQRRKVQDRRIFLRNEIPPAWAQAKTTGDFQGFLIKLDPWVQAYRDVYNIKAPLWRRLLGKGKRVVKKLLGIKSPA